MDDTYEVIAVRYGTLATSRSCSYYRYEAYGEPDDPMRMDYYFWIARNSERTVLVDTGFDPKDAERRGRTCIVNPVEALASIGIAGQSISQIIVTHGHYDHIGNLSRWPDASILIQRKEFDFWNSPVARRAQFATLTSQAELDHLSEAHRAGRVRCIEGNEEVAAGIQVRLVGGHTPGQQIVLVQGREELIVLASDALHFYEEMTRDMPYEVFTELPAVYDAYDLLRELEAAGALVVAGHDPAVLRRFKTLTPAYVVRLTEGGDGSGPV